MSMLEVKDLQVYYGVIRHYDVTGKNCPKYFVEHEDEWEQFKKDVDVQIAVVEQEVETASQQ